MSKQYKEMKRELVKQQNENKALQTKYDELNALYKALEINHREENKIHKHQIEILKAEKKNSMEECKTLREEIIDWKTKCDQMKKHKTMKEPSAKHKAALRQIAQLKSQKSLTSNQEMHQSPTPKSTKKKKKKKSKYTQTGSHAKEFLLSEILRMQCMRQRDAYKAQLNEMSQRYVTFIADFNMMKEENERLMNENETLFKIKQYKNDKK